MVYKYGGVDVELERLDEETFTVTVNGVAIVTLRMDVGHTMLWRGYMDRASVVLHNDVVIDKVRLDYALTKEKKKWLS